jgi:L-threonylcarbamoyladenylate synthase
MTGLIVLYDLGCVDMERYHLPEQLDEAVRASCETLQRGGVVLYPTDTIYGLAVDAENDAAVQKVRQIKGSSDDKLIQILVRDVTTLEKYARVTALARSLATTFLPGALAMVLDTFVRFPGGVTDPEHNTISVRIPNHTFCLKLAELFERPFTTTSANKSGLETLSTVDEILEQLGTQAYLIDVVVDEGIIDNRHPSTIVDARGHAPILIREGAIPRNLVQRVE